MTGVEFAVAVGVPQISGSLQPRRKDRHPTLKRQVLKEGSTGTQRVQELP